MVIHGIEAYINSMLQSQQQFQSMKTIQQLRFMTGQH